MPLPAGSWAWSLQHEWTRPAVVTTQAGHVRIGFARRPRRSPTSKRPAPVRAGADSKRGARPPNLRRSAADDFRRSAFDVPNVVNEVVSHVLTEGDDREARAVRSQTAVGPEGIGHGIEVIRDDAGGDPELIGDDHWIL